MNTHTATVRALAAVVLIAASVHAETIYISDHQGNVCIHDTVAGTTVALGSLVAQGFSINQIIGLAFDPMRDKVLLCARFDSWIYEMDTVTGIANQKISTMNNFQGGEVVGF